MNRDLRVYLGLSVHFTISYIPGLRDRMVKVVPHFWFQRAR